MSGRFCQLWLTCKDQAEAEKIQAILLEKHLVACVRQVPVSSKYRWQGKIELSKEVMLMMESKTVNFTKIEAEVAKLHSYDTFVLTATPINKISKKAASWLEETL